jgi:hypothetical protein
MAPWIGSAPNQSTQRTDGTRTGSEVWQEAKTAGVKIRAVDHDTADEDLADMINLCLKKDGGNTATANLPMGGFLLTGAGSATARTHSPLVSQVQDGAFNYVAAAGTGDAITLDLTPSITAYVAGAVYWFKATATNTGAATVNIDGVGSKDIRKGAAGATVLAAGDITSGGMYGVIYDGTNMQLVTPGLTRTVSAFAATILDDADAGAVRTTIGVPATAAVLAVANNLSDVAVAATAFTNIKQAASDTATGAIEIAIQSEMETATDTGRAVVPGRQHFHPGHPKFWLRAAGTGSPSLTESYNVTSITDAGTGTLGITIATDFSTATWAGISGMNTGAINMGTYLSNQLAGSITVTSGRHSDGALFDPDDWRVVGFGDHA